MMDLRLDNVARRPVMRRTVRCGFTLTEIMFAVIILGIGFIMVAAIFPVALQQAKTTTEEVTAASRPRTDRAPDISTRRAPEPGRVSGCPRAAPRARQG